MDEMTKDLFISKSPKGVEIALLENKKLIEYYIEQSNKQFSVGDIYLGRVKKVNPGLNAAFVDIGHEKDGFLHYLDLGTHFNSLNALLKKISEGKSKGKFNSLELSDEISKDGKISSLLTKGQNILVQIVKEPISTKGPRLTSEISIPGRLIVLVPFNDNVSISKKISVAEERKRLKDIMSGLKTKNFGIIVRTAAEGSTFQELQADLLDVMQKWNDTLNSLLKSIQPPQVLLQELSRSNTLLRDILNDSFESVIVDDKTMFDEVSAYIHQISPDKKDIVKWHKAKNPLFESFDVDKQIRSSFGRTITIAGGAYIIIEKTEALWVIDVNSGNRVKHDKEQEESALKINLEAAAEIARQLRLRDIGGIIVIDFIDLRDSGNRKVLFDAMRTLMKADRAKNTVLPPSKFGLIQVTRQRVRTETIVNTSESCATCNGTGFSRPAILVCDDIELNLKLIYNDLNIKKLTLHAHPFVTSYISTGILNSLRWKWLMKLGVWIGLEPENGFALHEYHFTNKSGDKILL